MKKTQIIKILFASLALLFFSGTAIFANEAIYRLYNSTSTEHLYTPSEEEAYALMDGNRFWFEGVGWIAPDEGNNPVYRLFNAELNDHLYTTDSNEVEVLSKERGWVVDFNNGPIFYSGGEVPVYRLYNQETKRHHLTTDLNEYQVLGDNGWDKEGVSLQAIEAMPTAGPDTYQYILELYDFDPSGPTKLIDKPVNIAYSPKTPYDPNEAVFLGTYQTDSTGQIRFKDLDVGSFQITYDGNVTYGSLKTTIEVTQQIKEYSQPIKAFFKKQVRNEYLS